MHAVDFGDFLRVLFYLWLLTSLGVYAFRAYKRFTMTDEEREEREAAKAAARAAKRGTARDRASDADDDSSKTSTSSKPTGTAKTAASSTSATSSTRINRRGIDRSAPEEKLVEGSLVEQAIREELEERRRAEGKAAGTDTGDDALALGAGGGGAGRKGLFAPLAPDADPAADDRPTVAEALEGITMPCDLVPLIGDLDELDPHHVVFVTTGHPAREVGARFADEMERLGFTMGTAAETTATATRGNVVVTIELHEDASTARDGDERRFPTAPGGSVAVELLT